MSDANLRSNLTINLYNYKRYNEAAFYASMYIMDHYIEDAKERQETMWLKTVEIFNDPNFKIDENGSGYFEKENTNG